MATCRYAQGRLVEARELAMEAFHLSQQIGMAFLGPSLCAARARFSEDPAERISLLQEGEAMLATGCLAPSRMLFYRDAIEVSLGDRNWDEALRYTDAMEEFVRPEPLVFAKLVAARGPRTGCAGAARTTIARSWPSLRA